MKHFAAALLCSVSTAAFAADKFDPSAHVMEAAYSPMKRTELVIQAGNVSNITFQSMESIDHVVKADTAPFDYPVVKEGSSTDAGYTNNLPIIGKKVGTGNLVVITRAAPPQDKERVYNIYVRVVEADEPAVAYQLTFTYGPQDRVVPPPDPAAPKVLSWKEKKAAQDAEIAAARLRSDVGYGPRNDKYLAQGRARAIGPVRAFDNGALTAFSYPGNMAQPSFFRVTGNNVGMTAAACAGRPMTSAELQAPEEAVNTRVVNGLLIVDHTAPHWRVRSGEAVIDIYNCGYTIPTLDPTGTGTGSPDVVRRIVQR